MKTIYSSGFRIMIALSLLGQPLQTAVSEMMAPAASGANTSGMEDMGSGSLSNSAAASIGESANAPAKQSSVIMGGITLPKSPLTMDFQDADVRDVLHLLALKSGLNIIYGLDVAGPVSVHLDHVPFDQAFHL